MFDANVPPHTIRKSRWRSAARAPPGARTWSPSTSASVASSTSGWRASSTPMAPTLDATPRGYGSGSEIGEAVVVDAADVVVGAAVVVVVSGGAVVVLGAAVVVVV